MTAGQTAFEQFPQELGFSLNQEILVGGVEFDGGGLN
jgi:hypothetical protein